MGKIKNYIKKYAFFYTLYDFYKDVKSIIVKASLFFYDFSNDNCLIDDLQTAYQSISTLRPEIFVCNKINRLPLDDEVDLSVIIPVFNTQEFLDDCLNSIVTQKTMYKYEVICVNDGSTDKSSEILDKYERYECISIVSQDNSGYSGARNTGLENAKGKYIMFIDSDDFVSDNYFDSMINKAETTNADIVVGCYTKCNRKSKRLKKYTYDDKEYTDFFDYSIFDGSPWGKIYRRNLWDECIFPTDMMFEDTIIFNIIFRLCRKIRVNEVGIYYYRIYGENTIDRYQGRKECLDCVWTIKYSLARCEELMIKNEIDYLPWLLLQCSVHIFSRLVGFSEDTKKSVFLIACDIVNRFCSIIGAEKVNFSDFVLNKLILSFKKNNYVLWVKCSTIYRSNNIKIKKGFRCINGVEEL